MGGNAPPPSRQSCSGARALVNYICSSCLWDSLDWSLFPPVKVMPIFWLLRSWALLGSEGIEVPRSIVDAEGSLPVHPDVPPHWPNLTTSLSGFLPFLTGNPGTMVFCLLTPSSQLSGPKYLSSLCCDSPGL